VSELERKGPLRNATSTLQPYRVTPQLSSTKDIPNPFRKVVASTAALNINMLSSIGRAAIRRVVARGNQSTKQGLQTALYLKRVDRIQSTASNSPRYLSSFALRRTYATTTKTKTTPASEAKAAKKPAKKAVKKTITKKKVVKKVKAKPKAKVKKAKKELTPEQKEKAKEKAEKKLLKEKALEIPKPKPATAWTVFLAEFLKGSTLSPQSKMTEGSAKFKALSPEQLEVRTFF
jgi:hypothetical protein